LPDAAPTKPRDVDQRELRLLPRSGLVGDALVLPGEDLPVGGHHILGRDPAADTVLRDGDIVNIDVTVIVDGGWHGDTSRMFGVGEVAPRAKRLIDDTDLPMTQIALNSGFRSLRRFNAVFAEVYHRPPREIRRVARIAVLGRLG